MLETNLWWTYYQAMWQLWMKASHFEIPQQVDTQREFLTAMANQYTETLQHSLDLSLEQISSTAEFAESMNHFVLKIMGIKTTD